jgi:hypothetical protein
MRRVFDVAEGVGKIVRSAIQPAGDVAPPTNSGPECDADEISQSAPSSKVPLGYGQCVGVIFDCDGKTQATVELVCDERARPAGKIAGRVGYRTGVRVDPPGSGHAQAGRGAVHCGGALRQILRDPLQMIEQQGPSRHGWGRDRTFRQQFARRRNDAGFGICSAEIDAEKTQPGLPQG